MTVDELLMDLAQQGVRLWVEDEKLHLRAPKGVMSKELRESLQQRKPEIISFLSCDRAADSGLSSPIERLARDSVLPLSFAQERFWFLAQMYPESPVYNLPNAFWLVGELDVAALHESILSIARRHEVLRTTFAVQEENPVQVISEELTVPLPVVDLQGFPEPEREPEAMRLAREDAETPFDIGTGPLWRVQLLRLSATRHLFFLTLHHIISDGWSSMIFLRELQAFYEEHTGGPPAELPELPIQFADFAGWERSAQRGAGLAPQVAYWKERLGSPLPSLLSLPSDRPRPTAVSYQGDYVPLGFSGSFLGALKKLARDHGVTLFMVILAAYQVLLHRLSGQEAITVGSPTAGRNRSEIEDLIGCFINSLVLRADLSGNPTFSALLEQVRQTCTEAYSQQDVPFERLVHELQPQRSVSYAPLFQAMLILHVQDTRKVASLGGVNMIPEDLHNRSSKFDITLELRETSDGLNGWFEYNTDLFDAATIARYGGYFERLLEGFIANPDCRIGSLPLMAEAERRQLLVDWNATARDFGGAESFLELIAAQTAAHPDAVAVAFEGTAWSYGELDRRSNGLAWQLKSLGVGRRSKVGVSVSRSPGMLAALLGVLKAGGAYVPLDPNYPHERLAFMMADSGLEVLLSESALVGSLPEFGGHLLCLEAVWADLEGRANGAAPDAGVGTDDLAYVIYTSGSTGQPKGVEITHGALTNFLCSMAEVPGLTADDRLLAVTTLSFDISGLELYLPLTVGASVVIASRETASDGVRLADYLAQSGATVMQAAPSTWRMLLEAGWDGDANLKILSGGEALPRELADRLLGCGGELWNLYGPTETTIWSTAHRVTAATGSVSVGRPIANTEVYILDAGLEPVPVGVTGELFIGGAGLARGYLGRADLTAQRFVPHPFSAATAARLYRTGDLARYRPDGEIEVLGRLDHQVKLRGHRIELGEIEAVLGEHAGVEEAVVVLSDNDPADDKLGARLVAYLVPRGEAAPTAEELRGALRGKLPDYMVPSFFVMLEAIPRTANEKVDRRALPAPEIERVLLGENYVAPRTPTEQNLAEIWAEVLGLEQVGIHDDFFEIGGHSLLAVRLFARTEDELGIKLPLATLFSAATVSRLAAEVSGGSTASDWSCLVPIHEKGTRPALYCVHGEGGEVLFYRKLAEFLGEDQPVFGLQAYGLDGINPPDTTFEAMASRYNREIRQRQADGPYYLAGHCSGGVIAFEMAHQLQAQGQQVALLAMLDGAGPPVSRTLSDSLVILMMAMRRDPVGLVKYLVEVEAPDRLRHIAGAVLQKFARHKEQSEPETNQVETALQAIWRAIEIAYMNYEPRQYDGKIICFVNSQRRLLKFNRWSRLASKGTETYDFPGDPQSTWEEPSVGYLADKLRQYMDRLVN